MSLDVRIGDAAVWQRHDGVTLVGDEGDLDSALPRRDRWSAVDLLPPKGEYEPFVRPPWAQPGWSRPRRLTAKTWVQGSAGRGSGRSIGGGVRSVVATVVMVTAAMSAFDV